MLEPNRKMSNQLSITTVRDSHEHLQCRLHDTMEVLNLLCLIPRDVIETESCTVLMRMRRRADQPEL